MKFQVNVLSRLIDVRKLFPTGSRPGHQRESWARLMGWARRMCWCLVRANTDVMHPRWGAEVREITSRGAAEAAEPLATLAYSAGMGRRSESAGGTLGRNLDRGRVGIIASLLPSEVRDGI